RRGGRGDWRAPRGGGRPADPDTRACPASWRVTERRCSTRLLHPDREPRASFRASNDHRLVTEEQDLEDEVAGAAPSRWPYRPGRLPRLTGARATGPRPFSSALCPRLGIGQTRAWHVGDAPCGERVDDLRQLAPLRRQPVGQAARVLAVGPALDQSAGLQAAQ